MSSKEMHLCETHKKKFVGYCESCNINICLLCTSKHDTHELLQYNEIQPSNKKVEELKQKFIEFKKQNQILKEKISLWLEKINYYINKIQEILEFNENLYENILSNYDTNNLIYSDIDNLNQLKKKGLHLGYKNINLDLFSTDDKILEKSELILKTIKEMQIEDIFFTLKEQKNMLNLHKNTTISSKNEEKEQKEYEDKEKNKEKKKVVKKKKGKIFKKVVKKEKDKENKDEKENIKDKEKELTMKKYEDFKEIDLKSKLFDDEYLINLDKTNTTKEKIENNLMTSDFSSLVKSISNRREISHLCMVSFETIKYIVTTGYCYINLFDLKGDLQRSIKIHDSDITYLIQMKNGDLLSCAIDGTMKIIRLGKNEGYSVIQTIDTTKEKVENNNSIFTHKLFVLLQIKNNENIITALGTNLLIYKPTKDNKDIYEFNYILKYNKKEKENEKKNYYDMILNNNSISSLIEINNDNFVGLNNNTVIFFEKDEKNVDKYIVKDEINNICGSGGPNNILYFDNKIIIGGGDNIYIIDAVEKKILKEMKINCNGINCIDFNLKNDGIFIGYQSKENEFEIKEYGLINQKNKFDLEEKKVIKKAHSGSITNIIPLEENEKDKNEDMMNVMNVKISLVSGAHDKYLKYWA